MPADCRRPPCFHLGLLLSLLRGSLIVMILSLTGRGISVSFVTLSFLIAKPTPASLLSPSGLPLQKKEYSKSLRLPDSENLDSYRTAMSMLYLASSIATSAVRLSGWSALLGRRESRLSIVQLSVVVFFVFFFLADFRLSTEDEVEQRGPW